MSRVTLERWPSGKRRYSWGRKDEEYIADFVLLSRRALTGAEYRVFKFHFLLGADWRLCCLRLKVDRGTFFHCIYRIEQKLGHAFRETEPYGLFPLSEYFGDAVQEFGTLRKAPARAEAALRAPLARAC